MPTPIAKTIAKRVSSMVPGIRSRNSSVTGRPVREELPKSSCTARPRKRRYCTISGWARPNNSVERAVGAGGGGGPRAAEQAQVLHDQWLVGAEQLVVAGDRLGGGALTEGGLGRPAGQCPEPGAEQGREAPPRRGRLGGAAARGGGGR